MLEFNSKVQAMKCLETNRENMEKINNFAVNHVRVNDKHKTIFSYREIPTEQAIERAKQSLEQETFNGLHRITTSRQKSVNPYHNNDDYIPYYKFVAIKGKEYIKKNNLIVYTFKTKSYLKKSDLK